MKLNLTNGKDGFSFFINRDVDPQDWQRVMDAKRRVTVAMDVVKKRVGPEVFSGMYPVQGQALEGLDV